ncbi:MAG: glycosyltransferase family 4 protein [bacterium]
MNILMVHPHDLWHDPWTIRVLALARGLQQRGHAVHLVHLPRKDPPRHGFLREPRPGDPPCHALQPRQHQIVSNSRLLYQLAAQCDVIHLQKCFAATALPLLWISRMLKKPLHYDWDDNETAIARLVEKRGLSRLQLAVYERSLPRFTHTLTYSSQAIRDRALRLGFPADRMWHLPVGADTDRFHPDAGGRDTLAELGLDPNRLTILYIGQLEGAAHADLLVRAAPRVLEQIPDAQFLIVGGGGQEDALRRLVEQSPARDALHLTGYIAADRIPAIASAADIGVACFVDTEATRSKSPLKIAEYLASGKPIVASRVGETPWMLEDCGLTVEPGSAPALAEALLTYARDPERRSRDSLAARERALRYFTWDRGVETLLRAYAVCLGNSPALPPGRGALRSSTKQAEIL